MLKSLSVENYALIDKTYVVWNKGFSIITGETGSGKSILLGALGLIQGARADIKALKDPEKKCVVEAEFDVSSYSMQNFFEENDIEYDDICIIRREIGANGKSRAFVNDSPVTLPILKDLSSCLIDIHSQHETLQLNQDSFQLSVLDSVSDTSDLLTVYSSLYTQYVLAKKKLTDLRSAIESQNSNRDYIEFQLQQFEDANFSDNEQTLLEEEMEILSHSTELKDSLSKSQWLLSDKDDSICSALKSVGDTLASISSIYKDIEPLSQRISSTLIELKDVEREVEQRLADVTVDPQRLDFISQRLDLVYTLEKKHKVDNFESLLEIKKSFEEQLSQMDSSSDLIEEVEKEITDLENKLNTLSGQITKKRESAKSPMEDSISSILHDLGMVNARFSVSIEPLNTLSSTGKDSVKFLFSANKNAALQPISSVASGGELSRVMLALKYILSKTENLPTIILDEIDTGVSGEVADRMGKLMKSMGESMQVVSITHLPQIASKGETHYKVYKEDDDFSTVSHIKQLTQEDRVQEIAQMLSGANPTPAAIENAKELLGYN